MSSNAVQTPEDFLGYKVGTDRKIADWPEIVEYFTKLGEATPRVVVEDLGETTEGNPFILATITSEDNHAKIDELRKIQLRLSNPTDLSEEDATRLIEMGKTVVLITCSIHSTEIGGSQMSMELAHKLASDDGEEVREILENTIFLLVPSLNPDGNRLVVEWYERYLGTEYEGSNPPYVYHKYAGHDNNRDWYMFTLKETQLAISKVHNVWHPQIVYDIHQMGRYGPRFYVPPFTDPYEPNIDPVLTSGVNFMGSSMADALAREGKGGVSTHWVFDAWTPARAYQHYHGGIRILSEAASVKLATPIEIDVDELSEARGFKPHDARWNHPMPWKGGKWTLGDIVDYEYTAAFACLQTAAKFRRRWLRGTYEMGKRALDPEGGPYAFIIPDGQRDPGAVSELIWVLRMGDIKVDKAVEPLTADGVEYPAGSYVVKFAQPYGGFVKTLLEHQVYPDLRDSPDEPPVVPYDVTGHTMSLQLGVEVVEIADVFDAVLEEVDDPSLEPGSVSNAGAPYYLLSPVPNYAAKAVNTLLKNGYTVNRSIEEVDVEGTMMKPGTFIIESKDGIDDSLEVLAQIHGLDFIGVNEIDCEVFEIGKTRIGIYRAWLPIADEGWLRMVLDEYGFDYVNLYPEDVRKGGLSEKIDLLIIPDLNRAAIMDGMKGQKYYNSSEFEKKYTQGIGEVGNKEVSKFVEAGGTILCLNRSNEYAVKDLWAGAKLPLEGLNDKEFYCPGSLLRVLLDNTHPVGYGFSREETIMYLHSPVFELSEGESVAWYPEADPLISGWILGEKHLRGKTAVAEIPAGDGVIIMIGCPPHFRNQNRATFKLLFNSIYYGSS